MKANRSVCTLLLLLAVTIQIPAQQTEADRKRFEEIKSCAEKGDSFAQFNLGICYDLGNGVTKNLVEAVKWYRNAAEQLKECR